MSRDLHISTFSRHSITARACTLYCAFQVIPQYVFAYVFLPPTCVVMHTAGLLPIQYVIAPCQFSKKLCKHSLRSLSSTNCCFLPSKCSALFLRALSIVSSSSCTAFFYFLPPQSAARTSVIQTPNAYNRSQSTCIMPDFMLKHIVCLIPFHLHVVGHQYFLFPKPSQLPCQND